LGFSNTKFTERAFVLSAVQVIPGVPAVLGTQWGWNKPLGNGIFMLRFSWLAASPQHLIVPFPLAPLSLSRHTSPLPP
jgi:hypothetical protein